MTSDEFWQGSTSPCTSVLERRGREREERRGEERKTEREEREGERKIGFTFHIVLGRERRGEGGGERERGEKDR